MQYKRNDGRVTSEVLAQDNERVLVKSVWNGQEYPNIVYLTQAYFQEKYSNALSRA